VPFSYEGYKLAYSPSVEAVPLAQMGLKSRAARLLGSYRSSAELIADLYSGRLSGMPGVGERTLAVLRSWAAAHAVRGKDSNEAKRAAPGGRFRPPPAGHGPRAPQEDGQN
jgi:hypothetical protein